MSFPNPTEILLRPRRAFGDRRPSAFESALVVLAVAVTTAVSLTVTAWASAGGGTPGESARSIALSTGLSFVFAWFLVAGTLVVLIPSRVDDLGGMLATIGWGFAPAVVPAIVRVAMDATTPTESIAASSLGKYAGEAGYSPLFAVAVAALVWQWYVTFRAIQGSYDVGGVHAAVATAVPFGFLLAVGDVGLSLGLPEWRSIGSMIAFFGLAILLAPHLFYDFVVRSSLLPLSSKRHRTPGPLTLEAIVDRHLGGEWHAERWQDFLVRPVGVVVAGAGFVMFGGPAYVV